MKILADFHIHIYPFYSIENLFISLLENFKKISALNSTPEIYAVFLAERYDCNFFDDVVLRKEKIKSEQFQINATFDNDAIEIQYIDGNVIYLFPGRQIVTKERLEILSLCSKSKIPDGLSAFETINSITKISGIPVLSWAPGKWFFQRGKIVNELLNTITPENLFIGDTSLRPTIWKKPLLMRKAENLNFKTLISKYKQALRDKINIEAVNKNELQEFRSLYGGDPLVSRGGEFSRILCIFSRR